MYGTVARFKVKPGMVDAMLEMDQEFAANAAPGYVAHYVYQMDNDPLDFFVVVMFESREAYRANAESPEQNEEYLRLRELLAAEPEWHDGEIIFPFS